MKKKRITILVPCSNSVPTKFMTQLIRITRHLSPRYHTDIVVEQSIPVDKARNILTKAALKFNPDYILWLDSDNILPAESVEKLINKLDTTDADLVTALYFEKGKPYMPVIREFHSGGFWTIENPALGEYIEVAGCGFGSCVMKPDVFKEIDYPWFKFNYETWGKKDIQLSEDLYFCREMLKKNKKIYCHTGIISGHVGSAVDAFEYMSFASIRQQAISEREELVEDLKNYLKISEDELFLETMVGEKLYRDAWNKANPKTNEEVKQFYRDDKSAIFALFQWHFTQRRQFDVELITGMHSRKPKNILDFGCGIGQNAIMLGREGFNVTIADLDSPSFEFAKERLNKHKVPFKEWNLDKEETPPEEKYDVIMLFDVLEHLTYDELKIVVEKIIKLKHESTFILWTTNYGKSEAYPMHFDEDEKTVKLMQRLVNEPMTQGNVNTQVYWDEVWKQEGIDTWRTYPQKFDRIVDIIKEKKPDQKVKVADIGCGVGVLLRKIKNQVPNVRIHGLDISKEAIDLFNKADPDANTSVCKFPDQNPFKPDYFDVAIATEFIEHMTDEQLDKFFPRIKNMLNRKGMFICSTPNNSMPKYVCVEHEQDFTEDSFRKLLEKHFKSVTIEKVMWDKWEFLLAFCEKVIKIEKE